MNRSGNEISFVVIGLNEERMIRACLKSVMECGYPDDRREIIYVDSGSTDRTLEIVQSLHGVKVISLNDPHLNAAKGRNAGWWAAKGEFIQFLDGDMVHSARTAKRERNFHHSYMANTFTLRVRMRALLQILRGTCGRVLGNAPHPHLTRAFQLVGVLLMVLALDAVFSTVVCYEAHGVETRVILRMDDEGFGRHRETGSGTGLSDAALVQRVLELVAKHGAKITIGVIPNVVSGSPGYRPEHPAYRLLSSAPQEVTALRQAITGGYAEVALHGWTHEVLTEYDGHASEFGGRPFEEQSYRLDEGRKELERCLGTRVDTFVPPFNNHDSNTLRALRALGFTCISSVAKESDDVNDLFYVSATTSLKALMRTAPETLSLEGAVLMNAVFHAQDFLESGSDGSWLSLADFDGFLARMSQRPNIEFTTIRTEAQRHGSGLTNKHSRLCALYMNRINRVADIPGLLGFPEGTLHRVLPSTEVLYPYPYMRRAVTLMLCIEALTSLALFLVVAICVYITLKITSHYCRLRMLRTILFSGGGLSLAFLLLEGIFGIVGTTGFGSRLVLAVSASGGLFFGSLEGTQRKLFQDDSTKSALANATSSTRCTGGRKT